MSGWKILFTWAMIIALIVLGPAEWLEQVSLKNPLIWCIPAILILSDWKKWWLCAMASMFVMHKETILIASAISIIMMRISIAVHNKSAIAAWIGWNVVWLIGCLIVGEKAFDNKWYFVGGLVGYELCYDLYVFISLRRSQQKSSQHTYTSHQDQSFHDTGSQQDASHNSYADQNLGNDFYKVLGIDVTATDDEVEKAYHDLVQKYHPDKVEGLDDEIKRIAQTRFREIQEAYENIKTMRDIR